MEISEFELEDMIFLERFHKNNEAGLVHYDHDRVFRQLDLGIYGVPDLIGISYQSKNPKVKDDCSYLEITIYELKKGFVDISTIAQANRYQYGLKKYIQEKKLFPGVQVVFNIVLIGLTVDKSDNFLLLASEYDIYCYEYQFNMSGLSFLRINTLNHQPTQNSWKGYGDLTSLDLQFIHKNIYKSQS